MTQLSEVARPYAKALFSLAREQDQVMAWRELLSALSLVMQDEQMLSLLKNPAVTPTMVQEMVLSLVSGEGPLQESWVRWVHLLIEAKRLEAAPEMMRQFEELVAEMTGKQRGTLTVAAPVDEQQLQAIISAVQRRLNSDVELNVAVDPSIVGGAVIRVNDTLIDASVKGKFRRLHQALLAEN